MKQIFFTLAAMVMATDVAPAADRSDAPSVVYYASDAAIDRADESKVVSAYHSKYKVVTPRKNDRYTPPRVTATVRPRTSPGAPLLSNGPVRFAAIVTAEGRITKPTLLKAFDDYLGLSVVGVLPAWRCKPALLNGAPVAAIMIYELDMQRPGAAQSPRDDPGLGHLPRQDR